MYIGVSTRKKGKNGEMTEENKKYFDEIFNSGTNFGNVSDVEFLRSAAKCSELCDWVMQEEPDNKISHFMHFAYWLGRMDERRKLR